MKSGRYRQNALDEFRLARSHAADGELAEAAAGYQRALEEEPNFVEALINLGITYYQLGSPHAAKALECFNRAIQLKPTSARAHYNMGVALAAAQRPREAAAAFQRAVANRPQHRNALYALSVQWNKLGDPKRAKEFYRLYQRLMVSGSVPQRTARTPRRSGPRSAPLLVLRFIR